MDLSSTALTVASFRKFMLQCEHGHIPTEHFKKIFEQNINFLKSATVVYHSCQINHLHVDLRVE